MKRILALVGALLSTVVVASGTAQANHAGQELIAYGKGSTTAARNFDFSARLSDQQAGELLGEPHGRMHVDAENFFSFDADVTCLTVVGNRATIGGQVTSSTGLASRGILFYVTDNTLSTGDQIVPDEFFIVLVPESPQVCPPPGSGVPLASGDIVVEQN